MLVARASQIVTIPFVYRSGYEYVDPTANIFIYLKRGFNSGGPTISGPYIFDTSAAIAATPQYVQPFPDGSSLERISQGSYQLTLKIPSNIFPGQYTIGINTTSNGSSDIKEIPITIKRPESTPDDWSSTPNYSNYSMVDKSVSLNERSKYREINQFETNNILLIGHTDAIEPYGIQKISSMQEAIDILRADFNSPLLRGVFDAYSGGARDIYICPAAPMSEYVESISKRLDTLPIYSYSDATPMLMNFYQRYYDRLSTTYDLIKIYDNIDIVVPLETTILNSGGVDFMTQLANYCNDFHNESGFIQVGIIGSRSNGISSSDIDILEANSLFTTKYTAIGSDGQIIGDMGRFIMPVYGEVIFNHEFLNITYTSSASAAIAGLLSQTQVNMGLARKRLSAVYGLHGNNLSQEDIDRLEDLGINTIYRSNRARRGNAYEIYVTNDYSMASSDSTLAKIPQIRLLAMLINEIKALSSNSISRFSSEKIIAETRAMLNWMKSNQIVVDYQFEPYVDTIDKGKLYFDISVTSALGLKKISFSISSGAGS